MLASVVAVVALLLVATSTAAPVPGAWLLLASSGNYTDNLNQHYLHPLHGNTATPTPSNQSVSYNTSAGSHWVFDTHGQHGNDAFTINNDRTNTPLLYYYTGQVANLVSLSLDTGRLTLEWSYPITTALPGRTTYDSGSGQYYGFSGVNDISPSGNDFVLTVYQNFLSPDYNGKGNYQSDWYLAGGNTMGQDSITTDSENGLLFIALDQTNMQGTYGVLLTYCIANQSIIANVTYGTNSRLHYSTKRQLLYSAQISDDENGLRVQSIDIVNPATGKGKVVIDSQSLPMLYGLELEIAYDDASGEWFFLWSTTSEDTGVTQSAFFAVNIDSGKVSDVSQLAYDSLSTEIVGLFAKSVGDSDDDTERVTTERY